MDIVVVEIPPKYGMLLSRLWAVLALCNLPKAEEAVTEATSKPLRVLDLALQDSERDLSVKFRFV